VEFWLINEKTANASWSRLFITNHLEKNIVKNHLI